MQIIIFAYIFLCEREFMKVIVIGGGASGLVAAIAAAKNGADVTLLEKNKRVGEKLLLTGNGRCNISNENMETKYFYGNTTFTRNVLKKFTFEDCQKFFLEAGVFTETEKEYLYPSSKQSSSVVNALRDYATHLKVKIKNNNEVRDIRHVHNGFVVNVGIDLEADAVIVATGGLSYPRTGCTGDGFDFAKDAGHTVSDLQPALVALETDDIITKASGVRVNCEIKAEHNKTKKKEIGQLQITDYGISGICVFNISRICDVGANITIDFAPERTKTDLKDDFKTIVGTNSRITAKALLNGLLPDKLSDVILEKCGIEKSLPAKELNFADLAEQIINYQLHVTKRRGFEYAQTTQGGISPDEINPRTMESKKLPKLYFCGELIDIDGICGGYNLHFAFATGKIAGENASK